MKMTKKLGSLLLAVLLLLSLSVTAFAGGGVGWDEGTNSSGNFPLFIEEPQSGHTYTAYQIFTGTLYVEKGKETLSDIEWGNDITETGKAALIGQYVKPAEGSDPVTAADVAAAIGSSAAGAKALADFLSGNKAYYQGGNKLSFTGVEGHTGGMYGTSVPAGYYMILDSVTDGNGQTNVAVSDYIVQVVGSTVMQPKSDVPKIEKKVHDDDGEGVDGSNPWQDYADYDVGDKVPFQFTISLPSNYSDYDTYKLVIHDKESAGLTFDPTSVKVTVDGTELTSGYSVQFSLGDGCAFHVTISDLKTAASDATANSKVVVTYSATLNDSAVIGRAGNSNTVYLEYSNNPNGEGTGHTPEDTVTVFTFQVGVNKVDEENNPLKGADFTIEKLVGTDPDGENAWKSLTVLKDEEGTKFTTERIDEGIYKVTETATPAGYNSIEPFYVKIDATDDTAKLTSLSATKVEYNAEEGEWVDVKGSFTDFTVDLSAGAVSTNIVNQSGLTLPETGGMGTTIFYVAGGILVAVALILLVTKRRVKAEQ